MPQDEIRFGAKFQLRSLQGPGALSFQIVGVDEADVRSRKVSLTSPIARAVTGKRIGDAVELSHGGADRHWRIERIDY